MYKKYGVKFCLELVEHINMHVVNIY